MHIERVLIVEDNEEAAGFAGDVLRDLGCKTETVQTLKKAREMLVAGQYDLVLLDVRLPDGDGIELLREFGGGGVTATFMVTSGDAAVEVAVNAMRLGAVDYLIKPFTPDQLEIAVKRADSWDRLREENAYLRGDAEDAPEMIGASPAMQQVRHLIRQVCSTQATVLIYGESGTGKELVAKAIQAASPRRQQPYIRLNCAAIPANLMESELFGHEKGAFTGAVCKRHGRFEMADGGTLLLDEISEIPLALQAKLLRVLQEREFERVGGSHTVKVDVRVLATTNRQLKEAVNQGTFREDLFYRLNVVPIHVPPLRERSGDIDLLVDFFLRLFAARHGKPVPALAKETRVSLQNALWPGNVRELQNSVERAVILAAPGRELTAGDFGLTDQSAQAKPAGVDAGEDLSLDQMEKVFIEKALKRTGGNVTQAARLLGISVRALHYKLAQARQAQPAKP
ncbi:MAG: sigma-54 dependent transcriptional regulator [Verrucomicrobiae bacterium]|nr:sigma-54 dependent transcriptional regulator [Verrucomicrobiae bacterium]